MIGTGIVELEAGLPAGRVRLNVRTPDGRVIAFRPNDADRTMGQSTEQHETIFYDYWQRRVGHTVGFITNRYGVIVHAEPSTAPQAKE